MKKRVPEIIKGLFILLFTYTALSKLYAVRQFQFVLSASPLLKNYSGLLAASIPAAEIGIAILIFIPATAREGMIAGISLLLLFTAYIIYMVLTDTNLPCSCGGVIQQLSWKQHIVFNLVFIAVGSMAIGMARKKKAKNERL